MTRRRLLLGAAALGSAAALLLVVAAFLQWMHAGEVVPSVTVNGSADLGGLSHDEARAELATLAGQLESEPVTVTYGEASWELLPADIGFRIEVDATTASLASVRRDGGTLSNLLGHVLTLWTSEQVSLVTRHDASNLDDWLATVASEIDQTPDPGGIDIDPDTLTVTSSEPREGREVDQSALTNLVLDAMLAPGADTSEVPVEVLEIRIQPAQVAAVADRARTALEAPMLLTHELGDLEVSQQDLAALLSLREVETDEGFDAELHVTPGAVEEVFSERTGDYEREPINAGYAIDRRPPVTFDDKSSTSWQKIPAVPDVTQSSVGWTFEVERIAAQLAEMARTATREQPLALLLIEPEFTTDEAEAGQPSHLLSTFTTYHACCQTRVVNIQKLADMVDGTIVQAGKQFSINQISGERTCSRGFVEAGMILRGEIVPSCGGGVSQFGTTTFNAAFFAGVQLDDWKAHSFYISRYPQGREATINYPSPDIDVLWTNVTDTPILVKTSYTRTSITVSFYGRSSVDEVEAVHGQPTRWRNWSTEYRENKSLKPGTSRVIQSGQRGFTVVVVRKVHRGNDVDEREIVTVYQPERQIVERNTSKPKPSPTPSPEPDPTPTSHPDPTPEPQPSPTDEGG